MMFLKSTLSLIQLIVVLICVSINEADETDYIVGGVNVEKGELPYQISLQDDEYHICGGSIIKRCWILTAAHCVEGSSPSAFTILAGTTKLNSGGVRVGIEKIILHPQYNNDSLTNDIAILKLKKCLTYKKNIQKIELGSSYIGSGVSGIVSGWGFTDQNGQEETNDLKKLTVKTISNQQCSKTFGDINNGNICTLNKVGQGFCQGDSGGPLVDTKSKAQMGVVSANIPCARGDPDIYTRVSTYVKWIKDNAK